MKPDRISTQRGRGSDKEVKRKRDKHPAEQQLYGNIRAQAYHRQHLLDLLKQAINEQDHDRAAVAAVVMLAAQDPSYLPGPEMMPGAKMSQYFPDVAAGALEAVRQDASVEELKRYMRKMHDRQISPEQAELVTFELVYMLAERGLYQEAYDVLDSNNDKRSQHFHTAAICGFLRHAQVCEILERTSKQGASGQPQHSDQHGLNMFQHDEQIWTKGGQQLQEFWNGAEAHLKEALRLNPGAVPEGCLLSQLYMMAGLPEDALETARALQLNAPADSDSHGLFILMKEAEGPTAESMPDLAKAYVDMLRCDPFSENAVQGLLGLHARLAVAHTSLLEAAALHLDVTDEHSPSAIQAWAVLAQTLSTAARALLNLQASVAPSETSPGQSTEAATGDKTTATKDRHLGAPQATPGNGQSDGHVASLDRPPEGNLADRDRQGDRQPSGDQLQAEGQAERQPFRAEGQDEGQPQVSALPKQQGSSSPESELEAAWGTWKAFQELLPVQRHWWKKLHFRWREAATASEPLEPPDDPDHMAVLSHKAITAALMYSEDDAHGVNIYSGTAAFVSAVQDDIEAAGEFGIAQDVDEAVEMAQTLKKVLGKRAQDSRATPFGAQLPEYGLVSSLPAVWWSVFPFKRRQQQPELQPQGLQQQ